MIHNLGEIEKIQEGLDNPEFLTFTINFRD